MPSLLEALEQKYCSDCGFDSYSSSHDEDLNTTTTTPAAAASSPPKSAAVAIFTPKLPPLLCVPELLVLNDCDIDCAGDFESIRERCQRVRELDLAQNKLQDWQEVFQILRHMPRIEFLNLSKNHLRGPITQFTAPSVSNLRGIVLNGTYLNWRCVDVLLDNLPILEELHLSLNNYREVLIDAALPEAPADADDDDDDCKLNDSNGTGDNDADATATATPTATAPAPGPPDSLSQSSTSNSSSSSSSCSTSTDCPACLALKQCKKVRAHRALKTLHFTGNPIEHWQEICRLGRVFPALEHLVLADCPIKSIALRCPECESSAAEQQPPHKHFANLQLLNLSSAQIRTWDDIDKLAMFPKLRNLRVKNWPLWDNVECTEHERRQLLIARLPNVSLLNGGGPISVDEREDAERAFIRHYMRKPEHERPARYDALVAKHGNLDPLVNVNLKPDKRIKINITFRDKTEQRYVDIYRSVADLKVKLQEILGFPANKMRLFYLDKDYRDHGPEVMKYPNKLLYSYNIQTEDEIIVDEKK